MALDFCFLFFVFFVGKRFLFHRVCVFWNVMLYWISIYSIVSNVMSCLLVYHHLYSQNNHWALHG